MHTITRLPLESLANLVRQIPAEDIPGIVHEATGKTVAGPIIEPGPTATSYKIHSIVRPKLVDCFKELFETIDEPPNSVMIKTYDMIQFSEFGQPNLVRNCEPENPYWFEQHQIVTIRAHLTEGEPGRAFSQGLLDHNHGHSGFTDQVIRVYYSPWNDEERQLSLIFRELHIDTTKALLEQTKPTTSIWKFMAVESIMMCIERLGAYVPEELVAGLKELVGNCLDINPEFDGAVEIRDTLEERFPDA